MSTRGSMRTRRVQQLAAAVLAGAWLAALPGCTVFGGGWVEEARFEGELMEAPGDLGPPGCGRLDGDHRGGADPDRPAKPVEAATPDLGTGNDPYTGAGARQLPGPFMAHQPPPDEPVSALVVRPSDPDEHVAARNLDGEVTGPVPEPKVIATVPTPDDPPAATATAGPSTAAPAPAATCVPAPPL